MLISPAVSIILKPLAECAAEGFLCSTSDNRLLLLNLMIASYVADIPEAKGFLSIERENRTIMPCHMCQVKKEDLSRFPMEPRRCWKRNESFVDEFSGDGRVPFQNLKLVNDCSLLPLETVLVDFTFAATHSTVDVYSNFKLKPMNSSSLGISRRLEEECLLYMLSDENRTTSEVEAVSESFKSFKAWKSTVIPFVISFYLTPRPHL